MPLLLSTISYLIYKKKNVDKKEPEVEPFAEPEPKPEPKPEAEPEVEPEAVTEPKLEPKPEKEKAEEEEDNREESQTYVITEGKWEFLWQAPAISIVRNFILLKELIQAKNEKDEVKVDAKIQNFRIYQTFGEIIPIVVLRMTIAIHDQEFISTSTLANETLDSLSASQLKFNSNFSIAGQDSNRTGVENLTKIAYIDSMSTIGRVFVQLPIIVILSLILENISVLIRITEAFIYTPVFLRTDLTRKKIIHQTRKAHLFILPLLTLIFTPRYLSLVLLLSVWRGIGCLLTFAGAVTIYTLGFAILIFTKYLKEWKENISPLLKSYFTSFFIPYIIMYPESGLVFWSSLISTLPHLFLISALLFMANHYPEELYPKLAAEGFYFLIPCLLIAPVFSWLIQSYSQEKTQKILLGAISFKLVKFFVLSIVLCALDELSDILSAMEYFR